MRNGSSPSLEPYATTPVEPAPAATTWSGSTSASAPNTANTPTELLELSYPVHVKRYAISDDGGGAGTWRGGCGIEREIRFEREGWLTITTDRAVRPPYGLFGGTPARPTEVTLVSAAGEERSLPSKTAPLLVEPGSTLTMSCAGGGGYGPPQERALEAVQADLDDGYVTPEAAERLYGRHVRRDAERPDGPAVVS
jgi:N-methylhydantoinase B